MISRLPPRFRLSRSEDRIGIIEGVKKLAAELHPVAFRNRYLFEDRALSSFQRLAVSSAADIIVFGHTHRSHMRRIDGVLLFNPGGVHQWNPVTAKLRLKQNPGWFEWCWLQFARHLQRWETPSVGVLEIDEDGIMPRVIEL